MSKRLDQEREAKLQPKRMEVAVKSITDFGLKITHQDETTIRFVFENETVTYFPYSGWATGKSIKDGRGLQKLLRQLKPHA